MKHFDCAQCKQRGFTTPAIIIGVLILIVGGVLYLNKSNISKVLPSTPSVKITPSPTPDETANSDLIGANWKTYTNKSQDYTFKYPTDWNLQQDSGGFMLNPTNGAKYIITARGPDVNTGGSFETDISRMQGVVSKTKIVVGKYTGIKVEVDQTSKELNRYLYTITVVFEDLPRTMVQEQGGRVSFSMELVISDQSRTQEAKAIFNQILSTFKFLDQTSSEGQFCGGIAGTECPTGYSCQLEGDYPDAGGKCVRL